MRCRFLCLSLVVIFAIVFVLTNVSATPIVKIVDRSGNILNLSDVTNNGVVYIEVNNNEHTFGYLLFGIRDKLPIYKSSFSRICGPCLQGGIYKKRVFLSKGDNFITIKSNEGDIWNYRLTYMKN